MVLGKKNRATALTKVTVNIPMQVHPAASKMRRRFPEMPVFFIASIIGSTNYEYKVRDGREYEILKEMKK